jgi:PilZ domain-containing protein
MQNKRLHKRYDLIEIQGRMTMANKVEIMDIGLGGIAVKADRKLDVGREFTIRLGDRGNSIDVRCMVVRSTLSGMEKGVDGENVLIYAAGMKFIQGSEDKIKAFLESVEPRAKEDVSPMAERRRTVRFQITAPQEKLLLYPEDFKVKDIDLGGMLILADQFLEKDSMVPMALQLDDKNNLDFIGQIFSCRKAEEKGQAFYAIQVTFSGLRDRDRDLLKTFISYLVTNHKEEKS